MRQHEHCSVELNGHSGHSVSLAAQMAAAINATLTLVHVTGSVEIYGPGGSHVDPEWKEKIVSFGAEEIAKLQRGACAHSTHICVSKEVDTSGFPSHAESSPPIPLIGNALVCCSAGWPIVTQHSHRGCRCRPREPEARAPSNEQDSWKLQIVERRQRAFKVKGLTWIVERSFAWLGRNRRLSKDYELKCKRLKRPSTWRAKQASKAKENGSKGGIQRLGYGVDEQPATKPNNVQQNEGGNFRRNCRSRAPAYPV